MSFLFFLFFLKFTLFFIGDHFVTSRLTSHPPLPLSRPFFLYEIFFCDERASAVPSVVASAIPWRGSPRLFQRSNRIPAEARQRLALHSTTLGAFQEPCTGIPLRRDLQSEGGTSKASVRLGVDDYNPPGYRFTRLLNFKSSCGSILACTFAFLAHKSCHVNSRRMLDLFCT